MCPAVLLAALALGAAPALAAGNTYTVSPGEDAATSKSCTGIAPNLTCPTLRQAVVQADAAPAPAVISLKTGAYGITEGPLEITSEVSITGPSTGRAVIERTKGEGPIIRIPAPAGTVTISNVKLVDSYLTGEATWKGQIEGGLVYNDGALVLTGDELSGSAKDHAAAGQGARGGAIFNAGRLTITHSSLSSDQAVGGTGTAGEKPEAGGPASGGAIYNQGTSVTITGSTLNGDQAVGGTGGSGPTIGAAGGSADGGAITSVSGTVTLVNDTLTGDGARGGLGGEGTGNGPGKTGGAAGGAVEFSEGAAGGAIGSTTVSGNSAVSQSSSRAGNLDLSAGETRIADTIIASGSALEQGSNNCLLTPSALVDGGHNLEDDTQSQCGFSAGAHDVTAPALVEALASNGGPVRTIGLLPGSPALGSGGQCTDPSQGGANLTQDARELPRPAGGCDIGAFQAQPVTPSAPPVVAGNPDVGQTLTCGTGTWGGDGPLSYSYEWLRNGVVIAGQNSATYLLAAADAYQQVACRVTARGPRGQATQTGFAVLIAPLPGPPAPWPEPVISHLTQSAGTWVRGNGLAHMSRRLPVGTVFSFTLNEAATITFTFTRPAAGRMVGHTCKAPSSHNRGHRSCLRAVTVGAFSFLGYRGRNHIVFRGHISSRVRLAPGRHTLIVSARSHKRPGVSRYLSFTVAG
jgi:hypothetical protein